MKSIILAKTGGMDRSEWLALRGDGIGGSDAAAVVGVGAYKSPYTLWAEKTGLIGPQKKTSGCVWAHIWRTTWPADFAKLQQKRCAN